MKPLGVRQQLFLLLSALLVLGFSSLVILSRHTLIYPATDHMAVMISRQLRWLQLHCGESIGNGDCAPDLAVTTHRPPARSALHLTYHDRLRLRLVRLSPEIDDVRIDEAGKRLWLHTHWSDPYWLGFPLPDFAAKVREIATALFVLSGALALVLAIGYAGYLDRSLGHLSDKLASLAFNQAPGPPLRHGPREMRLFDELLDRLGEEKRRLQRDRTLMLLGISHDLRGPLARIAAAASLLEDDALRQDMEQDVVEIGSILDQFQTYVHHATTLPEECVNLGKVIERLCRRFRHGGMDVRCMLPSNAVLEVKATSLAIQRIMENLLQNACKHGRPPVIVSLRRRESHIEVVVRDHGDGIPAEMLSAVVHPFIQVDPARGKGGSGLGLAIVQQELNMIGGLLELHNHSGGGLLVRFRLPIWPDQTQQPC